MDDILELISTAVSGSALIADEATKKVKQVTKFAKKSIFRTNTKKEINEEENQAENEQILSR